MSGSSSPSSVSFTQPLTGVRSVETRTNDTLQTIAARELGDAAQWPNIANLNGLLPPYLTTNLALVSATVLFAGMPILVPAPSPPPAGVADPVSIYGTDLLLVNGQITGNGAGDYQTVSGLPNLEQALENALDTHPGDLVFHRSYGCDAYRLLGQGANQSTLQLAAAFVAKTVRADPRVASATGATATVTGDVVAVAATAITADGKRLPVGTTSNLSG